MNKIYYIISVTILVGTTFLSGRTPVLVPEKKIDSLKILLNRQDMEDIDKIRLLNEYARLNFYNQNYKNGFDAVIEARELSEKMDYEAGISMYHLSLAAFLGQHEMYTYHLEKGRMVSLSNDNTYIYEAPKLPNGYPVQENSNLIAKLLPLIQYYEKAGEEEITANIYVKLSWVYFFTNKFSKLDSTHRKVIHLYKNIGEPYPVILYLNFQMYLARFTNNSNKIEQVKNEIEEYIANINVSESYGSLQFLLGNYYRTIDERIRATENYLNSIEYFKSTDDFLLMSEAYGAIADLYGELEMHAKKADVLDKRLQVIEDNNINADLYGVYMGMAWAKYDNGEYDDAEKYMKLVQEHASQQNIFTAAKENQSLKAHILMDKGQYEEAIPIFKKVLNISLDKNYRETDEWEAYRLSYCYFKIQDLSNALKYGLISEEVLNPGNPRLRKLLNLHLSEIYDAVGNMEKSFVYLKKFKDGLINSQTNDISNKIMQTEISRLLDKNKEEVALLEKERFVKEQQNKTQRLWIFSISGAFLSALLIVLILYRNNKIKQKNNIQLERKKNQLEITLGQLKTTQSQLIQSEKMASLGELTAGIAHEIQNPLNFVNNFSEINQELIEEVEEEIENGNLAEIKEIIVDLKENEQKISEHGKRADSIVKGMLLHSRTSTGEKVFKDINGLCDEFVRLSYHGIRAKNRNFNADFELNLDPDLPQIKIIPQDIGRVLLNIINNAFCAASEEALRVHQIISNSEAKSDSNFMAKVTVSTKLLDDKIQISISDNGPGIPEEIKDKIFQPFFTTKPTGEGTGLGLSLAYDIVQAHGGNIDIDSEVGRGSNFIITLPYIENK